MTFSRHYAKARKAELKEQAKLKKTPEPGFQGQAQRMVDPLATLEVEPAPRSNGLLKVLGVVFVLALAVAGWFFQKELLVPIRHINVEGQVGQVNPIALQSALNSAAGHSMFANLKPLEQRIAALPWVKTVDMKRVSPNSLVVILSESEPVARFNEGLVLTSEGAVVTPPSVDHLTQLPQLLGPADKALFLWQGYRVMSDLLNPIGLKIWRLSLSPRFSYEVILNNGLILYLGTTQLTERLQLFIKVYEQQLAPKINQIAYVDLRYPSSLAIAWKAP